MLWASFGFLPIAFCRRPHYGKARSPKRLPGGKPMATGAAGLHLIYLTVAKSRNTVKQKNGISCTAQRKEDDPMSNLVKEVSAS